MPTEVVVSEVRDRLRDLVDLVETPVAEDVALAMVKGAAQGFREISDATRPDANRRLLAALELDVPAVMATLGH